MKQFDKLYINGEWVESNSTEVIEVINPATEAPVHASQKEIGKT